MILSLKNCICFFYSMKIEEDRIYEQKNPYFQESEKTIKKEKNIAVTHIFDSYIFYRLFLTNYTYFTL